VVNVTPRPLYPRKEIRYQFYNRLGGTQGPSGRVQKNLASTGIWFCSFSVLYPYCLVMIFLAIAYCPYCTTQTSMPSAGFEPAILAGKRLQTHTWYRSATGIGLNFAFCFYSQHTKQTTFTPTRFEPATPASNWPLGSSRFDPRTFHPVTSRYTDWAIAAPSNSRWVNNELPSMRNGVIINQSEVQTNSVWGHERDWIFCAVINECCSNRGV
jgi:hypothetical protein